MLMEVGECYFEMISCEVEYVIDVIQYVCGICFVIILMVCVVLSVLIKWLLLRFVFFVNVNLDIELRLDGINELIDFCKENVDIEIWYGEGGWFGFFVESFGEEWFFLLCVFLFCVVGSLLVRDFFDYCLIYLVKLQM